MALAQLPSKSPNPAIIMPLDVRTRLVVQLQTKPVQSAYARTKEKALKTNQIPPMPRIRKPRLGEMPTIETARLVRLGIELGLA